MDGQRNVSILNRQDPSQTFSRLRSTNENSSQAPMTVTSNQTEPSSKLQLSTEELNAVLRNLNASLRNSKGEEKENIPIVLTEGIQHNNTNIQDQTDRSQEGEELNLASPSLKNKIEQSCEHQRSEQEQSNVKNENELHTRIVSLEQRLAVFEQQLTELRQQFLQFTSQHTSQKKSTLQLLHEVVVQIVTNLFTTLNTSNIINSSTSNTSNNNNNNNREDNDKEEERRESVKEVTGELCSHERVGCDLLLCKTTLLVTLFQWFLLLIIHVTPLILLLYFGSVLLIWQIIKMKELPRFVACVAIGYVGIAWGLSILLLRHIF